MYPRFPWCCSVTRNEQGKVSYGSLATKPLRAKIQLCLLWSKSGQTRVPLHCPLCAKSRHDRPHSSTLAPKLEKQIRPPRPIIIDPPIVAAPRRIASLDVPIAPGKKEPVSLRKSSLAKLPSVVGWRVINPP